MNDEFSQDFQAIRRLDNEEKKEIEEVLDQKMATGAKKELEIISEINSEVVKTLEKLDKGMHPIECYNKLKKLRVRQERESNALNQELRLMKVDIPENDAVKQILEMEEKLAGIEDHLMEHIKENRATAYFRKKDLDRFLSYVSEAVKKGRDGKIRSYETGGVFRIQKQGEDLYFDRYIHVPPKKRSHRNYEPQEEIREVRKKVTEELEQDTNIVSAHSHPPGNFEHSNTDIEDIEGRLNVKGLSRRVGVLAIRRSEKRNSGIWVSIEVFVDGGYCLPIKVEGLDKSQLEDEYPLIHEYNEFVLKASMNDKKWYEYL